MCSKNFASRALKRTVRAQNFWSLAVFLSCTPLLVFRPGARGPRRVPAGLISGIATLSACKVLALPALGLLASVVKS
jgi:hypothetical protein